MAAVQIQLVKKLKTKLQGIVRTNFKYKNEVTFVVFMGSFSRSHCFRKEA